MAYIRVPTCVGTLGDPVDCLGHITFGNPPATVGRSGPPTACRRTWERPEWGHEADALRRPENRPERIAGERRAKEARREVPVHFSFESVKPCKRVVKQAKSKDSRRPLWSPNVAEDGVKQGKWVLEGEGRECVVGVREEWAVEGCCVESRTARARLGNAALWWRPDSVGIVLLRTRSLT